MDTCVVASCPQWARKSYPSPCIIICGADVMEEFYVPSQIIIGIQVEANPIIIHQNPSMT
jgi:hypothetical protein